ncbi:related to BNI4 Bud neck involved [Cephalotrichum gorgonifer]|uniref:Related to BNI4 Bud neck involved n=1 Tax=Cephalotrichum gorgonifer TaxID=2041049 RepID=A0AAE8MUY0_9PEZI|nr:related to BNI4 Bud neck involved [Cephalotrichum gorgonifer]
MAALVQTYPQQSATVTMIQTRPSSGSGLQQSSHQYPGGQAPRNNYHGRSASGPSAASHRASGPIKPYAFTSTPSLNPASQWQQFGASTPSPVSTQQPTLPLGDQNGVAFMGMGVTGSRDDSSIPQPRSIAPVQRPRSSYMANTSSSTQVSFAQATPIRAAPDRYRRPALTQQGRSQSAQAPVSGTSALGQAYTGPKPVPESIGSSLPLGSRPSTMSGSPADDGQRQRLHLQEQRRFRRRSMHTIDSADYPNPLTPPLFKRPGEATRVTTPPSSAGEKNISKPGHGRPVANSLHGGGENMHYRNNSSESITSTRSSHSRSSSANHNTPVPPTGRPSSSHSNASHNSGQEQAKSVGSGLRPSAADVGKRTLNPSPLSRPVTMAGDEAAQDAASSARSQRPATPGHAPSKTESPAAKHLAAINLKSKSKTSRLRRAFSFGSAAEFNRKAPGTESNTDGDKAEPSKLQKEPTADELYDAEQERIAKKQEAAGLGASIYGGRIFSGSTDNLSISSTASSASIMIRKMGRGMKKGSRSLVGLFRPKSIVGEPSADSLSPPETAQTTVSMVTVEAERERVNINVDPHDQAGGGTGFPRLERNSMDASKAPSLRSERGDSSGTDSSATRKSIVGGDRERAAVLAAVRKGILKRRNDSPNGSQTDLPGVPAITDSPNSSAPSTPNEEAMHGHKRVDSLAIGNEDYFVSALRLRDTKSNPGTPSSATKRNATFSPRIVFYDTWPSQEYDRRGEVSTCNRLTPMLAQQIKEELNSFKMEMEVHEHSKVYTHFF